VPPDWREKILDEKETTLTSTSWASSPRINAAFLDLKLKRLLIPLHRQSQATTASRVRIQRRRDIQRTTA